MATVNAKHEWIAKGVLKSTWANMLNTDVGTLLDASMLPDKTVSVDGTFGAGGTLVLEGQDAGGSTYSQLNDTRGEGNVLSFTSKDIRTVTENPQYMRPRVSGGDGTTSLTVVVISQSAHR